nr:Glu/Leu/Phe/Val dehydrogenase dimerization domain-containing protein [Archaeoglobus fulgidus]
MKFGACAGGIRMLPDVTVEEVAWLVRAMSLKAAIFGIPVGGAKGGICADPNSEHRREILTSTPDTLLSFLKRPFTSPALTWGRADRCPPARHGLQEWGLREGEPAYTFGVFVARAIKDLEAMLDAGYTTIVMQGVLWLCISEKRLRRVL